IDQLTADDDLLVMAPLSGHAAVNAFLKRKARCAGQELPARAARRADQDVPPARAFGNAEIQVQVKAQGEMRAHRFRQSLGNNLILPAKGEPARSEERRVGKEGRSRWWRRE